MPSDSFAADLELYGPGASLPKAPSLRRARRYCRGLARRHYENFTVGSLLLPRTLRQHFYNVYAYCRWADDLADEPGDPRRRLGLLDWWEVQLRERYRGRARHPVFVALGETIDEFALPVDPLVDLLVAFRQDQQVVRYDTFDQLTDYCRYSANPVGRLVLYLGRCHQPPLTVLADSICTGLQLANFCQDVAEDYRRGRIYFPRSHWQHAGCDEASFARGEPSEALRRLMQIEVAEAEGWLRRGLPLVDLAPKPLRLDVALFLHGGLAILDAIRRRDYDVWTARPVVGRWEKLRLLARCWWGVRKGTLAKPSAPRPLEERL